MRAEVDDETMTIDSHDQDGPEPADAAAHHVADAHDDHGHAEVPLGPIDVWAWGAGVLGVVLGLAVTVGFVLATA